MHKVNRFVKLAQEKGVVRLTDRLDMTIAVDWDVKPQTEQTKQKLETWPISLNPKYSIIKGLYSTCNRSLGLFCLSHNLYGYCKSTYLHMQFILVNISH